MTVPNNYDAIHLMYVYAYLSGVDVVSPELNNARSSADKMQFNAEKRSARA